MASAAAFVQCLVGCSSAPPSFARPDSNDQSLRSILKKLPPPSDPAEISCSQARPDPVQVAFAGIELISCLTRTNARPAAFVLRFYGPNTPAERSGLAVGDEILKIRGCPVSSPATARWQIDQTFAGSELPIVFVRQGKQYLAKVPTEIRPRAPASLPKRAAVPSECWRLGLEAP